MKMPFKSSLVISALLLPSILVAELKNGGFELWAEETPIENWASNWTADSTQIRAPGLGAASKSSVILRDKHFLSQKFTIPNLRDFQLKATVAVLESEESQFEQPFIIALETRGPDGHMPWIQLRLDRDGGHAPLRLRIRGKTDWSEALRGVAPTASTYDAPTNTFTRLRPYEITLTYSGGTDTYSIAVGAVGKKPTLLTGLKEFINRPATGAGLSGLYLYAYNQGFAIDDISIASAAPRN